MECERVNDIRLDALEVQDNAGADERETLYKVKEVEPDRPDPR